MPAQPSLCVYCGSRPGASPSYRDAAEEVGALIAARGWRLVYGAGDVGLMGAVAAAVREAGGAALGVIPGHLKHREQARYDLTQLVVTETMHERKKVMFMNADAVVVLPGGAGSLDEFWEVLTWRQLGLHDKPIYLLDIAGYWQPLLALLDHVIEEGFAEPTLRDFVTPLQSVAALDAELLAAFAP